ncbi:cyclic nucleotide-binding domain-containing protein [uncultured Psychrosphaera sp.]|jgi:CRP-like cAMP-binding protein|uniref:cyclic nucleotide-binding domain-containing protein n=1 Tax=uncultured Psychrosphaera sp. TaxID=1403522 RepID=UPI0026388CA3|nr:cyclic nucleotide-binding domain-containing protein [uncultured Psychrosphaera sp.]
MKEIKHLSAAKLKQLMNRLDFFRCLELKDRNSLVEKQLIKVRSYRKDEYLIEYGEHGDEFFMLMSGMLDVKTSSGKTVAELEPGQVFGEVAFILNEKRSASVIASEDVVVMLIDHKTLKLMPVTLRDKIKDKLIGGLVHRVEELNFKLEKFIL